MIDKKRLIEDIEDDAKRILSRVFGEVPSEFIDDYLKEMKELVNDQPKIGEWIPCSVGLPKEKGWYQTTCSDNEIWCSKGIVRDLYWYPNLQEFVDNIRYERNGCKEIEKFFWTKYVTAWMPLPEAYKE